MLRTKTGQLILSALAIAAYLLATAVEAAPARTAIYRWSGEGAAITTARSGSGSTVRARAGSAFI